MASFIVEGNNLLRGTIEVSGSKNAALSALAAGILFKTFPEYFRVPDIEDIRRMRELIDVFLEHKTINTEIAKRFRASILLAGPILARLGAVSFPHPGGCLIGARPIDVFLEGWRMMGAYISEDKDGYHLEISKQTSLRGIDYTFRVKSVTGTESLMMTAVLAHGITTLHNSACEPEIKSLADFLNANGAVVCGAGTPDIVVKGNGGALLDFHKPFVSPPDRIETGSLAILGSLAADELRITQCNPAELEAPLQALNNAGASIEVGDNWIIVKKSDCFFPVDIETREYPGFPTDLQAPFMVFLTQAGGTSIVRENIFEGRMTHVPSLNAMGARISLKGNHRAVIEGKTPLVGCAMESPDIRAGLAFIIAASIANGTSRIGNAYQIDRGYVALDKRLSEIGMHIFRAD